MNHDELPRYLIAWNPDADLALADVLREDLADIRAEVARGASQLFYFPGHGYLVTRVENYQHGPRHLVLIAARGRAVAGILAAFVAWARTHGVGVVRWHTDRPGVARLARRFGFVEHQREFRLRF